MSMPLAEHCEFEPRTDEVHTKQHYVIKFAAGWWFSPVSSTNKTYHHDIAEILLKVALKAITLTP